MGTVFISYARVDKHTALELRTLLKSYLPEDTAFVDTEDLAPGDRWEEALYAEIEASHTFLALVSLEWDQSENCQKEWKAATARRGLRVVPLAVGEGVVPKRLEAFKVFNSPATEKIPRGLGQEELRKVLTPIVERIVDVARPASPTPRNLPVLEDLPVHQDVLRRQPYGPLLRVTAVRDGTRLRWKMQTARGSSWDWQTALLEPHADPIRLGDALGEALLGAAPATWRDDPKHGPGVAHRCQVLTDEPALLRLPWRLARWRDTWLVELGWTLETGPPEGPAGHRVLDIHGHVALVLPQTPRAVSPPDASRLEDILARAGRKPGTSSVIRKSAELEDPALRPEIVLVAAARYSESVLLDSALGRDVLRPDTWAALASPHVHALILLGRPAPISPASWSPGAVICTTSPISSDEGQAIAEALLEALTVNGLDPVWAVEAAAAQVRTLAAASLSVFTRWATWSAASSPARPSFAHAVLREVNRDHQRNAATTLVKRLTQGSWQGGVLLLVGFSRPDADLRWDALHEQLKRYIELDQPQIALCPTPLSAPGSDVATHAALILDQLGHPDGRPLSAGLDHLLEGCEGASPAVLWLDLPPADFTPGRADATTLIAWLRTLTTLLAPATSPHIKVVIHLTCTSHDPKGASKELRKQLRQPPLVGGTLEPLEPLEHIDLEHIEAFLRRRDVSSCPIDHVEAIADLVLQETGGNFKDTVKALEDAERDQYRTLMRRLWSPP